MSRRSPLAVGWVVAASIVLAAPASSQDVYIESRTHTDAVSMMGRQVPAQDGTNRTWIGEGKIAIEDGSAGTAVIFRSDLNKVDLVNLSARTYYESSLPFQFPPEVAQMMATLRPEVTVTPTSQTKVVAGFHTTLTKVSLKMMGQSIDMNYWVSKDVGVSQAELRRLTQALFAGNPLLAEVADKMAAIEGYPVRVETTVSAGGSTFGSWQEVQKVEKRAAPPGTYDVPAGFKKSERMPTGPG